MLAIVAATATPSTFDNAASYDASIERAVEIIRENTAPSDPIFVGLMSNRFTWVNPLMTYYLANRAPGVRDTMYNPGVTNRDQTQLEMIGEMERSGVRYLVLDRFFAAVCEPFNASCEPGSSRLDEYIAARFRTAADFGDIVVLVRR